MDVDGASLHKNNLKHDNAGSANTLTFALRNIIDKYEPFGIVDINKRIVIPPPILSVTETDENSLKQ